MFVSLHTFGWLAKLLLVLRDRIIDVCRCMASGKRPSIACLSETHDDLIIRNITHYCTSFPCVTFMTEVISKKNKSIQGLA
jgi:hypothetical protein